MPLQEATAGKFVQRCAGMCALPKTNNRSGYTMNAVLTDTLIERGADAIKRAYPGPQKRYAQAAGITKSTASRHINGDAHSPATHYLRGVLIVGWSLIAEAMATLNQQQLKRATLQQLRARLTQLNDIECLLEGDENRAILRSTSNPTPEQLRAAAMADISEAEVQLERAAILRQMAEHV